MDLSGLTSVTTAAEMQAWLSANCLSPISPVMTGTDFGVIMQKIVDVTGGGSNGAAYAPLVSHTYAELAALVAANNLVPGQKYLLSDYITIWQQPVSNEIMTADSGEPLILEAISDNGFSSRAVSVLNPADIIEYDFNSNSLGRMDGLVNTSIQTLSPLDGFDGMAWMAITDADGQEYANEYNGFDNVGGNNGGYDVFASYKLIMGDQANYTGPGFKVKINGQVITINTGYAGLTYDDSVAGFIIADNIVGGTISVQIYNLDDPEPDDLTIEDDSAGTPGTPRTGWITYREDALGNSAYFDWRTVKFRRFKLDVSDTTNYPRYTIGASYNQGQLIVDEANNQLVGIVYNTGVTTSPNVPNDQDSPFVPICNLDNYMCPNQGPCIWNTFILADMTQFQDYLAMDGLGQGLKIGQGWGYYTDNLPNVTVINGPVSDSIIGSGCNDIHLDGCFLFDLPQEPNGLIMISASFFSAKAQLNQCFASSLTYAEFGCEVGTCTLVNVNNARIGNSCSQIFLYNANQIDIGQDCSVNAIINSNEVVIGDNSGQNIIANNPYTRIGREVYSCNIMDGMSVTIGDVTNGALFQNSRGCTTGMNCFTVLLTNSGGIDIGSYNSNIRLTNASACSTGANCLNITNGDSGTSAEMSGVQIGPFTQTVTFSGQCDKISIGPFGNYINIDTGTNIEFGPGCIGDTTGPGTSAVRFGAQCINNAVGSGCSQIEFMSGVSGCTIGNSCSKGLLIDAQNIADNTTGFYPWTD